MARIARAAGQVVLEVYAQPFEVRGKADCSPVTEADERAERVIVPALQALAPGVPVVAEEAAARGDVPQVGREFWLVDPLDGTKEFIKRNGEFTVNIALVDGHEPVLGVVHVPVLDRDYYGCRSVGAFRRDGAEAPRQIRVCCPAQDPVRVVGSRSHGGDSLNLFLERLGRHELVAMGSSLKLCLVAEGAADVYPRLGPTSEWDTAAAQAVVEAAGGRVTALDGAPLRYNQKAEVLNPYFLVFGDPSRNWAGYLG